MKTRQLTDVSPEMVNDVKSDFESEGCTVTVLQQANGNFTVNASCPDIAKTKWILEKNGDI